MNSILKLRKNINLKIEYYANKSIFFEIYSFLLALMTVVFWKYASMTGMIVMSALATLTIILTLDLRFIIPNVLYIIFMLNHGFKTDEIPYLLIIVCGIFVLVLLLFTFINGFKVNKFKSFIGLFGLAIFQIIPIFWNNTITNEKVLYLMYFADMAYLLIYIIFVSGIKGKATYFLAIAMSYLGLIAACECFIRVYELKDTVPNILDLWYYLGWGLCNEAGIVICMSIPFTFYLLSKSKNSKTMFLQNLKILVSAIGIILTTSRGSYLFGGSETLVLYVVTYFLIKDKKAYLRFILAYVILLLLAFAIANKYAITFFEDIYNHVFFNRLDGNGREGLWESALRVFFNKPLYTAFGSGMVSEMDRIQTAEGWQITYIVYHSSFFETIAISGLLGFFFLLVHYVEKYTNMTLVNKNFMYTIGIGYFAVDLYGLIDNTYHMYYYMIPLVLILSSIDSDVYSDAPYKLF